MRAMDTGPDVVTAQAARLAGEVRPDLIRDEVLAEIFAATVAARGDHTALVFGGSRISYADLDRRADAIARGLAARGIGPGDVVGLWMERGAELLVAQIGITKTGAAWLPFDAEAPVERIAVCLDDCDAKALLVADALVGKAPTTRPVVSPGTLAATAGDRPDPRTRGLTPDHPAYMIYTSGSTGVPKGIVITHRNICHFLRAANDLYGFRADDTVFQGASVAFDLSMEEIWIPLMVGATLHVATPAMMGDVENLPALLEAAGVSVLDTVPTLLAMLPRDVAGLRLILLGGEALPAPLVGRWATPGRRLFNTYGPTEATVVATVEEVRPGRPVTIGRPIANYTAYVVDEALRLCPPGQQGELLIGGPGVAKGYLKRPELTAEKFIANPFASDGRDPILYRSGDAVSLNPDGNLAFLGRIDDQVKIRGFRVELGEIEARLQHQPGVAQAAVVLRPDEGIDRLVAFLVPERGAELSAPALRSGMRREVPPYMVPDHFETVDELPRLSSGKVNRKALQVAILTVQESLAEAQEEPRNETEAALLAAAHRALGQRSIPFEADFFTDLGGHSLIAAKFVSAVRETPALASMTLQDIYKHRTLRALSDDIIARTGGAGSAAATRDLSFTPPPLLRRFLCGLAQAAVLPIILALTTTQWLGVFVSYQVLTGEGLDLLPEIGVILGIYICINAVTAVVAVAAKWLIIGRTKPGRYPLWGTYYFRWWLVRRLLTLVHVKWLQGSPAMVIYLRLLGMRVGRDAVLGDVDFGAADLITIGERTSIGTKVELGNAEIVGNELVIGRIDVGPDVTIGSSAVIGAGARIGRDAEILDLCVVAEGTEIPAEERWDGSPGRKIGMVDVAALPEPADASRARRILLGCLYAFMLMVMPAVSLLPIFPAFFLFDRIDDWLAANIEISYHWYLPLITWPTALAMTAVTVLLVAVIRWAILPRMRSGRYSIFSGFYMRKWIVSLGTEVTLETLSSLFATIFMRAWYRLMGAGIGQGAEISTNLSGRYDIVAIGARNFIADEVVFGDEEVKRGYMYLEPVQTGARVFVGNDAVVPPGASIPDGVLIGIKSKPPENSMMSPDETWFGLPPIKLPVRQQVDLGPTWTYEPSIWRKVGRIVFEALHTSFPSMLYITFGILASDLLFYPAVLLRNWTGLALSFIWASVAIALAQTLVVIGVKWLLMRRYEPLMKPMWSWWAMKTEAVAVMYWGLAGKVLLDHLTGTPFLPWVLRLFGARIGEGVCMHTTDITEFDCVEIGDFCAINALSALQTHLYEDRVMKVGRVVLGRGVTVGANSTVLYDSHVGDYAVLRPLTIVMKGESIPPNSEWEGSPAAPVVHAAPAAAIAA
jgi:non-ribosomal peptide synthetase-like protein